MNEKTNGSSLYKPCPYCGNEILQKPILEKQQGTYSILCPYCLSHRSEWVESIDEAILSWNEYMREENKTLGVKYRGVSGEIEIAQGK